MRTATGLNGDAADTPPRRPPVLLIGVGSELRRDDAAGRRVVDRLREQLPPDRVEVRSVHQLTPELADEATGRALLIVVDAAVDVVTVTVRDVQVETTPSAFSHRLDVPALLRLAAVLGTPPTEAVTVAVPARDLAIGTELSAATARDVEVAVEHVVVLCGVDGSGRRTGPGPDAHDQGRHYPHSEREDPR